jgi:hypothetical protein
MRNNDSDEFGAFDDPGDVIPCRGAHRGVPLHDGQPPARIRVVKRDIDRAFELRNVGDLFDFAGDVMRAPEARLFAAAKLQALFETAAEKRWERPRFDRDRLKVMVNALDSRTWRHPFCYGTILDHRDGVPREQRLGEDD